MIFTKKSQHKKILISLSIILTIIILLSSLNLFTVSAYTNNHNFYYGVTLCINDSDIMLREYKGHNQYKTTGGWTDYEGECLITGTGKSTTNHIVVKNGTHDIAIQNVNITAENGSAFIFDSDYVAFELLNDVEQVNLKLIGDNKFASGHHRAGIEVDDPDVTLRIYGNGSLFARGGDGAAGIGGGAHDNCGNIIIEGGNITAASGIDCYDPLVGGDGIIYTAGAGIGGGREGNGGNVTITGGVISAFPANKSASGIGNGSYYKGKAETSITITGGEILTSNIGGYTHQNISDDANITYDPLP